MSGERASFGGRLRGYRERAGLTQEALAERAGLSAHAVSALESGRRRRPYPRTVVALADALGLSGEDRDALSGAIPRRAAAPAIAAYGPNPFQLPVPSTPLVGRERELEDIQRLLSAGKARLVTLTGPGGVGKTRLALEVAAGAFDHFPDGAVFEPLAPVGDSALVISTIARPLGISEVPGQPLLETLRSYLQPRAMLVVLDNFEQVLDAGPDVAGLLSSCPRLTVLATSRAPLRVRGEREYPVRPLQVPELGRVPSLDELGASPAVRLFVDRARSSSPAFGLTRSNAAAVAVICRRVDGLPLAIELAAARMRAMGPTELLARLDRSLPLLTGGARDLPERQRTMRSTIGWSYQLLEEPEWRLLNRLSVFRGGWNLEAAEVVGADGNFAGDDVLELLSRLVEQSLVVAEAAGESVTRYRMLVPVREYAEERLELSGEAEETRRRHAEYFLGLAERAEPELTGPNADLWLSRLDAEHDNIRAVLSWALDRREVETGLQLATALWRFWEVRGHVSEERGWVEAALAANAGVSAAIRARALGIVGWLAMWQGEHERARELLEESLGLSRTVGDTPATAVSLHKLGTVALFQGDLGRAGRLYEESVSFWRQSGISPGITEPLNGLGTVLLEQGELERAQAHFEECLKIGRASEDHLSTARALYSLAYMALVLGEYGRATALLAESMSLFQRLGNALSIVYCLEVAAGVAAMQGDAVRAARLWGASGALREGLGTPRPTGDRRYGRYLEATHAQLDQESYAGAEAEGREMTVEEAVGYALSATDCAPSKDSALDG